MAAWPAKRRFALLLAYQGGPFHGWQMQTDRRSVQETLGNALLALGLSPSVNGASRTDRGVHARAMVASIAARTGLTPVQLRDALRQKLPPEVRLRGVREVDQRFHAQFSSAGKCYRYRLWLNERPGPSPLAWRLDPDQRGSTRNPFSQRALMAALAAMVGRRSFRGAMAASAREGLCDLAEARLGRQALTMEGRVLTLSFRADRFGKYMVRTLVGIAVRAALGELDPAVLRHQLDAELPLGELVAPPEGLILWKVLYPPGVDPFPWLRP